MVDYESDKARYWRACDVWTFSEVLFLLNGEWPNEEKSPPSSLTTTVISFPKETIHDLGDGGFVVEHDTEVQVFNPIPDDVLLHQIVEDAVAAGRLSPLVHKSPRYKRDFEDRFLPSEVIAWATSRGCFPDFPFPETDTDMGSPAHPDRAVAFVVADSASNAPAVEAIAERNARWLAVFDEEKRTGPEVGAQTRAIDRIAAAEGVTKDAAKKAIQIAAKARAESYLAVGVTPIRPGKSTVNSVFNQVNPRGRAAR